MWTNLPLIEQKKAWKQFAKGKKLKYFPNGFLKSPLVTRQTDDTVFRLFSEEQFAEDLSRRRFTTVFEWIMPGMPTSGIIASPEMKFLVDVAQVNERIQNPRAGKWNKKSFIVAEKSIALVPYLTEERVNLFSKLIAIKNARFLYAFDHDQSVLRIETNDPLLQAQKIVPFFDKVEQALPVIRPSEDDFKKAEQALDRYVEEQRASMEDSEDTNDDLDKDISKKADENKVSKPQSENDQSKSS